MREIQILYPNNCCSFVVFKIQIQMEKEVSKESAIKRTSYQKNQLSKEPAIKRTEKTHMKFSNHRHKEMKVPGRIFTPKILQKWNKEVTRSKSEIIRIEKNDLILRKS